LIENKLNPKKKKGGKKDWKDVDALDLAESLNDTFDETSSSDDDSDSSEECGPV